MPACSPVASLVPASSPRRSLSHACASQVDVEPQVCQAGAVVVCRVVARRELPRTSSADKVALVLIVVGLLLGLTLPTVVHPATKIQG